MRQSSLSQDDEMSNFISPASDRKRKKKQNQTTIQYNTTRQKASTNAVVIWSKSESEVGEKPLIAPWLKSRAELETVNKQQPAENFRSPKMLPKWSVRARVRAF